jgi:type IV secretion system protein VirB4
MIRLPRLLKDYRDAGAFHTLLNLSGFIDDEAFLTKSGDVGVVLRVQGIDDECLTHAQTDQVARRVTFALRTLDERCRLYQYVLKRACPAIPHAPVRHPIVHAAVRDRAAQLQQTAEPLWRVDLYMAVVYEGWRHQPGSTADRLRRLLAPPRTQLVTRLSTDETVRVMDDELRQARRVLTHRVDNFVLALRDVVAVDLVSKGEAFGLLRRLLNIAPAKADGVRLVHDTFADFFACDSLLECYRDHLRLDEYYVKVLTLKEPPAQTFAHALHDLQQVSSHLVLASEWRREAPSTMHRRIQAKRRHFHHARASVMNYVNTTPTPASAMLIDEGAVATVDELGECLRDVDLDGQIVGEFSLTAVLADQDPDRLDRSVTACVKAFTTHDAVAIEERYNLLNAFLATVPGNSAYNVRRLLLLDTNAADLSFVFGPHRGADRNVHLGREYLAVFETNDRTPFYLNLHHQDVAHTMMLGSTGSGKSFLLNFLLTHVQKYEPYTIIFDLGGGYESLTRLFGGSFLSIGVEDQPFTINPFALPPTKEHLHFLSAFVRVLLESDSSTPLTLSEEQGLYAQIQNLYEIDDDQRRLLTLANLVPRSLSQRLQPWIGDGPYAALFDHATDNLTFARFQTFEFEGLDRYPDLLEPLLFYILHRATATIANPAEAAVFKLFVMDEAWRFFRHPTIQRYLMAALKTWRKKNAALVLATHSSDDLDRSELLPIILESCPTKIFLANPGMEAAAYRERFQLNEREAALIAGLIPKQQFLLKQPGMAKVLNLHVDPKSYWLYTSNPFDHQRRRAAFAEHGVARGLDVLANATRSA